MACGSSAVTLFRKGLVKMPLLLPLTTRARSCFTRRSVPSDGTSGNLSECSELDQYINHRSLIRPDLERTIRLMCDPDSPQGVLGCFGFPDNLKLDFLPITCPSHCHGSTNFSPATWHIFYPSQSDPSGPSWSRPAAQQFSLDWLPKE